jgi:hypothetical protein
MTVDVGDILAKRVDHAGLNMFNLEAEGGDGMAQRGEHLVILHGLAMYTPIPHDM